MRTNKNEQEKGLREEKQQIRTKGAEEKWCWSYKNPMETEEDRSVEASMMTERKPWFILNVEATLLLYHSIFQ